MPRASRAPLERLARALLAAASSLTWPAVVLVIPVGITFSAARLYAESSFTPTPECTESKVTSCADAAATQACECGSGVECACTRRLCFDDSGARQALVCEPVLTSCAGYSAAPCEGKAVGAACVQPDTAGGSARSGTCTVLSNCLAKNDAGFYAPISPIVCAAGLSPADAGTTSTPSPTPKSDAAEESGCSTRPGAIGDATLLAMPFGLALLFALRRRRR